MRAPLGELTCNRCSNRLKDEKSLHPNPHFACGYTGQVPTAGSGRHVSFVSFGKKHRRQQHVAAKSAETVHTTTPVYAPRAHRVRTASDTPPQKKTSGSLRTALIDSEQRLYNPDQSKVAPVAAAGPGGWGPQGGRGHQQDLPASDMFFQATLPMMMPVTQMAMGDDTRTSCCATLMHWHTQ